MKDKEKKTTTEAKATKKKKTTPVAKKRVFKNTPKKKTPAKKAPKKKAKDGTDRGRPTDYKPKYCKDIVAHMKKGYSVQSFAGVVGVTEKTLYNWMAEHDDFLQSVKKGLAASRLHWERVGYIGMQGKTPGFNSTVWIFNMKNRFKWADRVESVTPLDEVLNDEAETPEDKIVNRDDPAEMLGKIVAKYGKELIIAGKNQASRS